METAAILSSKNIRKVGLIILLWLGTAWLLYPLVILDTVNLMNAKEYLYRSAAGIAIMVILLGKTVCDLLFPLEISQKKSIFFMIFLTLYSMAIVGGIIFMISRIMVVYINKTDSGTLF